MPDLKPGTLCWITHCQKEDMGKIVEVKSFHLTHAFLGDVYNVYCESGVTIGRFIGHNPVTGQRMMDGGTIRKQKDIRATRNQLVPINDPKLSQDLGIESVEDQLKSLPLTRI